MRVCVCMRVCASWCNVVIVLCREWHSLMVDGPFTCNCSVHQNCKKPQCFLQFHT